MPLPMQTYFRWLLEKANIPMVLTLPGMFSLVKPALVQLLNASWPMLSTRLPMLTLVMLVKPMKAQLPMWVIPSPTTTLAIWLR